jgi:hypothetical protein
MGAEDAALLEMVSRGEFAINGIRNRDVRTYLWAKPTTDPKQQRSRSAAVTRKLRLLLRPYADKPRPPDHHNPISRPLRRRGKAAERNLSILIFHCVQAGGR